MKWADAKKSRNIAVYNYNSKFVKFQAVSVRKVKILTNFKIRRKKIRQGIFKNIQRNAASHYEGDSARTKVADRSEVF